MKPEIRFEPLKEMWVVIAPGRQSRPIPIKFDENSHGICPFCPGREEMTPPEIERVDDGNGGWRIRVIPNKFPALVPEYSRDCKIDGIYHRIDGVGKHELVIESPEHELDLAKHPLEHIVQVFRVYQRRYSELKAISWAKHVQIFRNWGPLAGASLQHPHTQIIALPFVPEYIARELGSMERNGTLCRMVQKELEDGKRVVLECENFVAFTPFASRFAFEVWFVPKAHISELDELDENGIQELARMFKAIVGRMREILGEFSYNLLFHSFPSRKFHFHVELTPRIAGLAGFELGTGVNINTVLPEEAASKLRGVSC